MTYKENQKFKRAEIWIPIIFIGLSVIGIFGFGIYKQIILGQRFGENPMNDNELIIIFIFVLLFFTSLLLFFGFSKLTTVIDNNGISYKFFPFHFKFRKILWDQIDQCNVITYSPMREFGGWGIKYGKNGRAYSISGNKGLQVLLKSGESFLIGTQNELELTQFLNTLKHL